MRSYEGFLSYAHGDAAIASALQDGVEKIARPWLRRERLRLFRDTTGLAASPDLWGEIVTALDASDRLVVLCSEAAASSEWVDREARYWLKFKSAKAIVLVHLDGVLEWSEVEKRFTDSTTSVPSALMGVFQVRPQIVELGGLAGEGPADTELEATGAHGPVSTRPIAELAALLQGRTTDDVLEAERRLLRRRRRLTVGAVLVFAVAAVASALLAIALSRLGEELRNERDVVQARRFALDARLDEQSTPEQAAGYALAAWAIRPDTDESKAALLNAAQRYGRYRPIFVDERLGLGISALAQVAPDEYLVGWSNGEVEVVVLSDGRSHERRSLDVGLSGEITLLEELESGGHLVVDSSGAWRRLDASALIEERGSALVEAGIELDAAVLHESERFLLLVSSNREVGVHDFPTGATEWSDGAGVNDADLVGDAVVVATDTGLFARQLGSAAEPLWTHATPTRWLAVHGEAQTIAALGLDGTLVTLDRTGEILNTENRAAIVGFADSPLVTDDDGFIFAGANQQVTGWSTDGELTVVQGVRSTAPPSAMAADQGRWIIGTSGGELIAEQQGGTELVDPPGEVVAELPGATQLAASDTASELLIAQLPVPEQQGPFDATVFQGSLTVSLFDTDTQAVVSTVDMSDVPQAVPIVSDGVVYNAGAVGLERLEPDGTWSVVADERFDWVVPGPEGGIVGLARGGRITALHAGGEELVRFDAPDVPDIYAVTAVATNREADRVAVTWGAEVVDVLRLSDLAPVGRIEVAWTVGAIAVLDAERLAIVDAGNRLTLYDVETAEVIAGSTRPLATEVDLLHSMGSGVLAAVSRAGGVVMLDLQGRPLTSALHDPLSQLGHASTAGDALVTTHQPNLVVRWELDFRRLLTDLCDALAADDAVFVDEADTAAERVSEEITVACGPLEDR